MDISTSPQPIQQVHPVDRLVYLVSRDHQFASTLAQQIMHFGYYVQHVRELKSLESAIADHHSVAILVDVPAQDDVCSHKDLFLEVSEIQGNSSPLIFISVDDDQSVRLKAIRVGGTAFFVKPVDIIGLIDKLDSLHRISRNSIPHRVLIIEDRHPVASYYQMVLTMSDMDVQIVTSSREVLKLVREFRPDLILMDAFMPEVNGVELARVIRQIEDYVSIPIIFLSSEDDFSKRVEALDLGADDFLIKPIKASHLVAVVRSRLERSRTLRSYMIRDSLTNLLNHTTFRNVLSQEVSRGKRQNTEFSLAMLDLDHFKRVNDTYGHAAGDSVLKSLSRLLRQRLQSNDIIGRYGGEEFVAILRGCMAEKALEIMDEIRTHFSEIEFYPKAGSILSVTFSGGVSTFPEFPEAKYLSDAADQALYAAKAAGRNQITIARP
ncbi:MAG: diguanylate cyclase [Anaerolineales bacterium]